MARLFKSKLYVSQGTHPAHLYTIFTHLCETQIPSKCGSRYDHASTMFESRCAMRSETSRDDARVPLEATRSARSRYGLQIILWTLWTLAVVVAGYLHWHADMVAQRPFNMLGLIIRCVVVGIIGLVVMTKVEMWLQPWRFVD
jgi:hypothetical protein